MSDDPCAPGPCGPTPANCPPTNPYACTIAAGVQYAVDMAARANAMLGLRPYNVFLIWQARVPNTRTWREDMRLQLFPVLVVGLEELAITIGENGQFKEGVIELLEVSPQQADERLLAGYRNGVNWAEADNDREFFYEVVHQRRCPGDPDPVRHRFTLAGPPVHDADGWQMRVKLKPQLVERTGGGMDQSVVKPQIKRPKVTT